jgi:type II secretory ATPase GspE/PulE/Tfp pilus assembly ATPase PilB-like protein
MSVSSNELGELLIDLGLITSEQLADAITQQQSSGTRLSVVLSEMGLITERQLKDALELQYGVNFVNLCNSPPEAEFVQLVPEDVERKFRFVPVTKQGNQYTVAMVDPDDLVAADAVRQHLNSGNFKKLVCTADDFEHLMYLTYEKPPEPADEEISAEENADVYGASASPRASQTKLKAHMRNLFESDSDDDLDSMFGGESGDDIQALSEVSAPAAEPVEEPQPKKVSAKQKVSKKITSLFDDDDDEDFGADPEPVAEAQPAQDEESSPVEEPLTGRPELTADIDLGEAPAQEETMPSNQLLEHILQEAGVPTTKPKKMKPKKKSMQSLFDDDDDMDFGSEFEKTEPAAESAEPEPEVETVPDVVPEALLDDNEHLGKSIEEDQSLSEIDAAQLDAGDNSVGDWSSPSEIIESEDIDVHAESEEPSDSSAEPAEEAPRPKSAATKAFRSLFDDEMDEDDLFGNESIGESLTGETDRAAGEADDAPEAVPDSDEPETAEPAVEDSEIDTAESLMSAIERPFQSLFDDDEDEEDLFRGTELTAAPDADEEPLPAEQEESENESPELPAVEDEELAEPAEEPLQEDESPEMPVETEEEIKPAYHASFDDEMDEDSLFASASHPIPEGAPHLRDLLSRFDDSDAAFDALEESLKQKHPEAEAEPVEPQPSSEDDAELAVSALIAALDEQVPDEKFSIPPRTSTSEEESAGAEPSVEEASEPMEIEPAPEVSESEEIEPGLFEESLTQVAEEESEPEFESTTEPPVASLPEVSQEVPAITQPPKKGPTQPKARRLRALMMDMDDEEETFGNSSAEPQEAEVAATTSSAAAEPETEAPAAEKVEFDEILPLDKEDLLPPSTATTELPPVLVSRSAKTMTQGTPSSDDIPTPAVAAFDEPEEDSFAALSPAAKMAPSVEETIPPQAVAPRSQAQSAAPAQPKIEIDTTVPLPATAAELPDALEDVLSNVTNEIIDNVELANLSGNRTEISFLEEIVESELTFEDSSVAAAQAKPVPAQQPVVPAPQPVVQPAAQPTPPAPVQPAAQTPAQPAAQAAPKPAEAPPAQPAAAPPPASSDLTVSGSVVEKLNLDPSILNLATQILTQAVNSPCSDVHFEPLADGLALRFMSDGDLLDETILPAQIQGMLILCLKSMAGLDPAVCDRPQDKRFVTKSFGEPVEMRITSIPGVHGEMVAVSLKT